MRAAMGSDLDQTCTCCFLFVFLARFGLVIIVGLELMIGIEGKGLVGGTLFAYIGSRGRFCLRCICCLPLFHSWLYYYHLGVLD